MMETECKYFPFLPGLWSYEVVAFRNPGHGEFFLEKGQVFKAASNLKVKDRQIVKPIERVR
jgi:hypothetical protein